MARRNDFQEIIGAFFSIIVLGIFGTAMISTLGDPVGLTGLFTFIFIIGGAIIGIALAIKILEFLMIAHGKEII